MAGKALDAADRFLMEAVDSVPDSAGRRVNLTELADEDGFAGAEASAQAWERAGYGTSERSASGAKLVFAFSPKGYAAAKAEADRLHAEHQIHARRRWKWPEFDGTSSWVAAAAFVVALLYALMTFFWG
jgi:hypothetical protein